MSAPKKAEIMQKVQTSRAPIRKVLRQLDVPKSTYYRWRSGIKAPGRRTRTIPWNRLAEGERQRVLTVARASPAWSSRQVAAWITDNDDFSVSESTVFRILKREGLVRRIEVPVPASNEYRHKTTAPHQLWATDASYFRVAGWGYYYMVTVLDDFSRFILAWRLQVDMTTPSLIEVVQDAVDLTGMTDVEVEDRTRLLSDNGFGLRIKTVQGIPSAGRYPARTRSAVPPADQLPYDVPRELEVAIGRFVDFYNYHRYHRVLKDITPADMLAGRREEILGRRGEVKDRTINKRRLSNHVLRDQLRPA